MLYMLDTANVKAIERLNEIYPLVGVTTNPSIITKEKMNYLDVLKNIRSVLGDKSMLHVQVLGKTAEEIIGEADFIRKHISGDIYIKIPVTAQSIKAMKLLKKQQFKITATAILTAQQGLMAAVAGADFLAPYVNRIDNLSGNGAEVVRDLVSQINTYGLSAKVVAASFKNVQQVHDVSRAGSHAITVNPELMEALIQHPMTDKSIEQFENDWMREYGARLVGEEL